MSKVTQLAFIVVAMILGIVSESIILFTVICTVCVIASAHLLWRVAEEGL